MPIDAAVDRSFGAFNFMVGVKDTASKELSKMSTHYDKVTKALGKSSDHMSSRTTAAFTAISNSAKSFGSGMDTSSLKKKLGKGILASKPAIAGMMTPLVGGLLAGGVTVAGGTLKKLGESFATGKVGKGIENVSMFTKVLNLTPKRLKTYATAMKAVPLLQMTRSTGLLSKTLMAVPWVGRAASIRTGYLKATGKVHEDTTTLTYKLKHMGKVLNQKVGTSINKVRENWEAWIARLALGTAMLVALKLEDNVNEMRKHLQRGEADAAKYVDAMGIVATMTKSSFEEVTEVMVAAVDWGFRAREGLEEFVITAIKLGKVTGMSGTDMAQFTYKLRDMYGVAQEAIPGIVGGIKYLADNSASSFGKLISHLDTAKTYMLRLGDAVSGQTAVAISALAATSESFWIDPSGLLGNLNEMTKAAGGEMNLLRGLIQEQMGLTGDQLRQRLLKGGPEIIKDMFGGYVKAIQAYPQSLVDTRMDILTKRFQTTEDNILLIRKKGGAALLDLEKNFQDSLMQAQRAKEMQKLYDDTMGTLTNAFKSIYGAFKGVLASLGAPLMVIVKYTLVPMAKALQGVAEMFQRLSPVMKTFISYAVFIGAIMSPWLIGWGKMRLASLLWAKALTWLNGRLWGVAIAQKAAWLQASFLGKAWIKAGAAATWLMAPLTGLIAGLWGVATAAGAAIVPFLPLIVVIGLVVVALTALWAIFRYGPALIEKAVSKLENFDRWLTGALIWAEKLPEKIEGMFDKFGVAIENFFTDAPSIFTKYAPRLAMAFFRLWRLTFKILVQKLPPLLAKLAWGLIKGLGMVILRGWGMLGKYIWDAVKGAFSWALGKLYGYLKADPLLGPLLSLTETIFNTDKMKAFMSELRSQLRGLAKWAEPIIKLYENFNKQAGAQRRVEVLLDKAQKSMEKGDVRQSVQLKKRAAEIEAISSGKALADVEKKYNVAGTMQEAITAERRMTDRSKVGMESIARKEGAVSATGAFKMEKFQALGSLRQLAMQARLQGVPIAEYAKTLGKEHMWMQRIRSGQLTESDVRAFKFGQGLIASQMLPAVEFQHGGQIMGATEVRAKFHGPEMVRPLTPEMTEGMDAALDMAKGGKGGRGGNIILDQKDVVNILGRMLAIMEKQEIEADVANAFGIGGGGVMGKLKALAVRGFDT